MPSPSESPSTAMVRCLISGLAAAVSSPSASADPCTNRRSTKRLETRDRKGPTAVLAGTILVMARNGQRVRYALHQKSNDAPTTLMSRTASLAKVKCNWRESMDAIAAGRLTAAELERNFSDIHVPLDRKRALIEASRCYFCFDAPCLHACPTGIDIPGFIRKISTDNVKGAAVTILSENIMGGACARACLVEFLCEAACVREAQEQKPVQIGALQRYATDWLFDHKLQPFTRAASSGKRVAVVGAGPAGLACAHRPSMLGPGRPGDESRPKAGGP